MRIKINDINDTCLDLYYRKSENQLLEHTTYENGVFIAESTLVIHRALDAGYEPVSFLIVQNESENYTDIFERCDPDITIYEVSEEIFKKKEELIMKFYVCETCGNFVGMVKDSGVPMMCCGKKMKELVPGTSDGAVEKHVPVYNVEGNTVIVTVGSVEHPMLDVHYIEWIAIETKQGAQRKRLSPNEKPTAKFALTADDELVAAYAYCNLHGLWKA